MCNIKCAMCSSMRVCGYMGRFGWLCIDHVHEVLDKIKNW